MFSIYSAARAKNSACFLANKIPYPDGLSGLVPRGAMLISLRQ
jgi:hypothetical protein